MWTDRTDELIAAIVAQGVPEHAVLRLPWDHPTLAGGIEIPGVCAAVAAHGAADNAHIVVVGLDRHGNDWTYRTVRRAAQDIARHYRSASR